MDISEAFRGEDITKTDFFDFVVTPDNNDTHSIQQFTKQMRTVNAFLGNTSPEKETNNNNIMNSTVELTHGTDNGNFDSNFWSDKETVRIETAILEDLNKYCWNNTEDSVHKTISSSNNNNNNNNNSDGQIYTLTVLNGIDQNTSWYRQNLIVKEEDTSSPNSVEQLQAGLDIDSFLNIIPGQLNNFNNNYNDSISSPNTDGLIKSETYTYEDSGFADNKDELANTLIIDTPLLEAHDNFNNNNNNDWKINNNNNNNNKNISSSSSSSSSSSLSSSPSSTSTKKTKITNTTTTTITTTTTSTTTTTTTNNNNNSPDSLLRSALQGKAFVRYNGTINKKLENNIELRRALSTPPSKTEQIYIKEENCQPTIVAGIDLNGKVVFEERIHQQLNDIIDNNSSSHNNVDDILLSQLDQSFPEDFEKLKRIANEVAESVSQYCQIDTNTENAVYSINTEQIGILNPIQITTPLITSITKSITTTTTTKTTTTTTPTPTQSITKKYKRTNNTMKSQSTIQNPTSTTSNNGIRKERSLHYCSICSKGFKDKYSVNVHIRTHTGEKPFACSLCGKSFRQKAHLAKHYQTHIAQKNAAAAGTVATTKTKSR